MPTMHANHIANLQRLELRDVDACADAMRALLRLSAEDVATILAELVRDASADQSRAWPLGDAILTDGVVRAMRDVFGEAIRAASDLDSHVERIDAEACALVDSIADTCDGFQKVDVSDARAWSDRVGAMRDELDAIRYAETEANRLYAFVAE